MPDLIPPHGGLTEPVCCTVPADELDAFRSHAESLARVPVTNADLSSVYRFADGTLSPLLRLSILVGELFRIPYLHVHYLLRLRRGDLYVQKLRSSLTVLLWTIGLKNSLQASNMGND